MAFNMAIQLNSFSPLEEHVKFVKTSIERTMPKYQEADETVSWHTSSNLPPLAGPLRQNAHQKKNFTLLLKGAPTSQNIGHNQWKRTTYSTGQ